MPATFIFSPGQADNTMMIPRQPAQYVSKQFRWRFALAVTTLALGIALGLTSVPLVFLGQRRLAFAFLVPALLLAVGSRVLESESLNPLPWLQGLRGERLVAATLAALSAEGFRMLHDVQTSFGNIDHVLLGPTGVFAIETKHWSGALWSRKGTLIRNGWPERKALRQAVTGAMEVRRRLTQAGMDCWVESLVVSTKATVEHGKMVFGHVTVLPVDALIRFATQRRVRLTDADITSALAGILRGDAPVTVRAVSMDTTMGPLPTA